MVKQAAVVKVISGAPQQPVASYAQPQPSASARDPRLQRKTPKQTMSDQEMPVNVTNTNSASSPTKKSAQLTPAIGNIKQTGDLPTPQNQPMGVKRTSPNTSQNPTEIKKPKYTIGTTVTTTNTSTTSNVIYNKQNSHDEKMIINSESPLKPAKAILVATKKVPQATASSLQPNNINNLATKSNSISPTPPHSVGMQQQNVAVMRQSQFVSKPMNNTSVNKPVESSSEQQQVLVKSPKQKQ